ncbi:MAG TPA: pyruvate, phosphate dikinase [Gammaproteobacteria bacterium]|mgnify:CR=1 FL=1|nr:pyruvate, phosphate dikinase [Gammaproteobacteria bacterium]
MSFELGPHTLAIDGSGLPDRQLVGGKAWSIARMRALGLSVPPAFVVTARACTHFLDTGAVPAGLAEELARGVGWLEEASGCRFGGEERPLLVSVRSGAAISMPGMMDTVLNLGITETTEAALGRVTGDPRFARDTHRRFLELYGRIVLKGVLPELGEDASPADWRKAIEGATGQGVPADPGAQLAAAVTAVFESWNSRRARRYRQHHGIPDSLGTAVTVQAMVFGNLDERSGTGVLFSRNPLTGERAPYGEYLARAQGEDVVSGRYTPQPLSALAAQLPAVHEELLAAAATLERENGDVQDIEFTVQAGKLYLLQTRAAKRAPAAALRFAVDMVAEGGIDEATALSRVTAEQVRTLLRPRLADGAAEGARCLARGEAACQGVGVGIVVTNTDEAERRALAGEAVVLARATTSPDDVHGMIVCRAVVTEQGGATSHAAVVSRALGVACVVGCGEGTLAALEGRVVTVDGASGCLYDGALPVVAPDENAEPALALLTRWAEARAPLAVVAEAAEAFDLGNVDGGEDVARLPELLAGKTTVRGGAIASDEGVKAAVAAGVRTIVATPRLPVLLAALEATRP